LKKVAAFLPTISPLMSDGAKIPLVCPPESEPPPADIPV